jgi:hypothetical protein
VKNIHHAHRDKTNPTHPFERKTNLYLGFISLLLRDGSRNYRHHVAGKDVFKMGFHQNNFVILDGFLENRKQLATNWGLYTTPQQHYYNPEEQVFYQRTVAIGGAVSYYSTSVDGETYSIGMTFRIR